jgi:hypothetical protein
MGEQPGVRKPDVWQGTLVLMVLKTLEAMGTTIAGRSTTS